MRGRGRRRTWTQREKREDVFFHHSDPSDSSIQRPPSLFDRRYFLRPNSVSVLLKFHAQMYTYEQNSKEKKSLKGAGNCKVKLSAAFHATAWQTPMVGWTSPSTRLNKTSLCAPWRSTCFPSRTTHTCNTQNMMC